MAFDYASEVLKQPEAGGASLGPQAGPEEGFDYAGELLKSTETAAPNGIQYPEYELETPTEKPMLESMKELWTGDSRRTGDWKEVPVNVQVNGKAVPIQDQMSIARNNDLARAQIFQTSVPGANVEFDEKLNPYTTHFGEPMYLNRPGASLGDVSEAINTLPAELLAARVGGGAGKGVLGLTGQIVGAGGALFGTSVAQDKFAQVWGSTQPVDWKRAQMMGMFGAGGEGVGMLLGKFFTRFFGHGRYVTRDGTFTKKGRQVLEQQGIDPDSVTKEFRQAFMNMIDDAIEPGAAVGMAEAQTLPKKVRLSKGDVTRDVREQALESRAQKGALGEGPQKKMDEFRLAQRDELIENRERLQGGIGQTDDLRPTVTAKGEGVAAAQEQMHRLRRSMYESMKAAYKRADESGMQVGIDGVRIIRDHIRDILKTFPETRVNNELMRLNKALEVIPGKARLKSVRIRELELLRQRLNRLTRSGDPAEAQAARQAVRALDEGRETAINLGMYKGDVDGLRYYQKGSKTRRLMAKLFEEDAIVNKILETRAGPKSALKRPPDEAANIIFTGDTLGFGRGAENALKRIKTTLLASGNQQAWNSLREEAVWRLFRSTESADIMSDGARAFSGKKFGTLMDKTFKNHKRVMNVLFTAEEQQLLKQFRNVAERATTQVPGAVNYSNTMIEAARMLEMVFGRGARIVQNSMRAFETVRDFGEQSMASKVSREAVDYGRGYQPPRQALPAGYAGGLSAIGATEIQQGQDTLQQQGRRRLGP